MSVQRSPPITLSQLDTPTISTASTHYNSDSALNKTNIPESEDIYFNITKRQKRTFDDLVQQPQPSFAEIKSMFVELKSQHEHKYDLLNNALLTIITQNQEIQKAVVTLTNNHQELLTKIDKLELENNEHKSRILTLEKQLESVEKCARSSTMEVRNFPKQENESKQTLINIIKTISTKLCLETPIHDTEIRDIYRSKAETVVVDFTTAPRMESVISQFKLYNKNKRDKKEPSLNSEQLELPGPPRTLYLSEYLTTKARHIFYVARQNVKNRNLVAAWTAYGKIYIKKYEDSKPVKINEESDLSKIIM